MVWDSHLFQNCSQFVVIHTVKGFGIVNKAEIDVCLELSCSVYLSENEDIHLYFTGEVVRLEWDAQHPWLKQ